MRKKLTIILTLLALAVQPVGVWAATMAPKAPLKKIIVAKKTFTGPSVDADQWGPLQVTIVVRKTTTTAGGKKTVKRHIDSIKVPVFPDHTGRSQFISANAIPLLVQEALKAQSTHIYIISGATFTSDAFGASLQAAITKEKAW